MRLIINIITSLLLCLFEGTSPTVALPPSPTATASAFAKYPIEGLKFIGPLSPGGENVTLYGTAETVLAQLKELNPNYENEKFSQDSKAKRVDLETRNKNGWFCGIWGPEGPGWAYTPNIIGQIQYLKGLNGGCYVGARTCVRLTCNLNNAIYLCNDNYYAIWPACWYLATYAEDILNVPECQYYEEFMEVIFQYTNGQEFDTDGYDVIVAEGHC